MENASIREVILSIVQDKIPYPSFIGDILKLVNTYGIDFYDLLINYRYPKLVSAHPDIPEETKFYSVYLFTHVTRVINQKILLLLL